MSIDPTASADEQLAFELLRRTDYGRVATSMRALPFLAAARHIVVGGQILLRLHRGYGYHHACVGSVVAYGADNLDVATARQGGQWTVQCIGLCEAVEPSNAELELFGPAPHYADGELFDPVYLRIEPQVTKVHTLTAARDRGLQHAR
ncbi:pyridoxamine 5'-phosphate oxidase family protein [Streptomyces alboniger]|uniref:Pyridoxamine 5'-phosphate oxidase family protein n=1 Tax=Streptomyces alboniger TaxID=132473 RepID=A0A5J6HI20_STRAD|nr:pyridoxamine 5'-phosphate oxidase family protein [Streptomyces alboniger]QEV19148.1 pyridoxamine 5'-phosphate oxidase family protein [Streptomyces alboniger]